MTTAQRWAEKFESIDATLTYTFPLNQYEWQSEQGLRVAYGHGVGADYAHDFAGISLAPKSVGIEVVRFMMTGYASPAAFDTAFDAMLGQLMRIGQGKLFTNDSAGTRRWCYARLTARPSITIAGLSWLAQPVALHFTRLSDWFGASATTGSRTVTVSPDTFTINNPGNAPAKFIVFRLRANAAAGFTNPALANLTNGYSFSTTRDSASADSEIKVDTELASVEFSTDNGVSYADDYALFSLGATQVGFMQLEPGNNSMRVTCDGTPNFDLEWSFYAPNQ